MKAYPIKYRFAFGVIFLAHSLSPVSFGKIEGVAVTCSTQIKEGGEARLYEGASEPSTVISSNHGSYGNGSYVYGKKIHLRQFGLGRFGFVECQLARWGNSKFNYAKWTCTFTQTQIQALTDNGFNVCSREE